jgi:putative acetyltransferase
MVEFRYASATDADRVLQIWRAAVDATHDFLIPEDHAAIDREVQAYVVAARLWVGRGEAGKIVGFMGLSGSHMDALFLDPDHRGAGLGRAFVTHAFGLHGVLTCDVNEQNEQAVAFYRRLGFAPTGRSDRDGAGRPYPLVHLRLDQSPKG